MDGEALPVKRSREWLALVDSLTGTLEPGSPMTFVIGAGASLSSGAPSTKSVEDRWLDKHGSLFKDRESLQKGIGELGDAQKINPLKLLFEEVRPFLGYHCLATLGRERQVLVLNLNWDDALEKACEALSVPHNLLTVSSGPTAKLIAGKSTLENLTKGAPGIYSFHVHGRLDNKASGIRFGIYETLEFSSEVKEMIEKHYFQHPTVVVGASLAGDYDVIDLLRTLAEGSPGLPRQVSPFYIFSRQDERKGAPSDGLVQNVLFSRKSVPNFRGDPAVDFDRLLLDIVTRLKGTDLGSSIQGRPRIIPNLEQLAIPSPAALGFRSNPCNQHALVVEGDARIGKTSAALLLSHLYQLCDAEKPTVTWYSGPKPCADELQRFMNAKRLDDPNRVLVLEDPFGKTGKFEPNDDFVRRFARYLKSKPKNSALAKSKTRVIVTTRASSWRKGVKESEIASSPSVRSISAANWYADAELAAYLQSKVEKNPLLRREVHKRELATPAAIEEALSDTSGQRKEMIEEKIELLHALDADDAWYVVLARLQELWPNGVADVPLHDAVGADHSAFGRAALMLRKRTLDEYTYVVPSHSADREAIDRFFADHQVELEPRLKKVERSCGPAGRACKLWSATRALRDNDLSGVRDLPESVRLDWGPMFIAEAARTGSKAETSENVLRVLRMLRKDRQTFWSIRELVFETIRFWPLLHREKEVEDFLDRILADDGNRGRYLVLEGMLYVQAATYPDAWDLTAYAEVWDKLAAARHKLLRAPNDHIEELALLFDAFTWCPPRLEPHELRRWLDPLVIAADECSPLGTAMQFSAFYHPEGSSVLSGYGIRGPQMVQRERRLTDEEAEAAAFMVRWHFVHQSRARALLYRRDMEPAHAYLVHRILSGGVKELEPEIAANCERMVRALAESDVHAGWAIHLAMAMARMGFDPSGVAAVIRGRPVGDPGLITGVMTYDPSALSVPLTEYFSEEENNRALRKALSSPPRVEGVLVGPPPFCASRRPQQVQEILASDYPGLVEHGLPIKDEIALLRMLHTSEFELRQRTGKAEVSSALLKKAVDTVAAGDLEELESVQLRDSTTWLSQASPQECMTARLETLVREISETSED